MPHENLPATAHHFSEFVLPLLACPFCRQPLTVFAECFQCLACGDAYPVVGGQPDLRLRRSKKVHLSVEVGGPLLPEEGFSFDVLRPNPLPEVNFSGIQPPLHFTPALMTYFTKATSAGSVALDLGCGRAIHRGLCEHAGYTYVAFDYGEPAAPMLGDGHALPFRDNSFDFIISMNVLEHIQNPFVMMGEAFRVLKPGGTLIGTVAFLEPFHQRSFYHHTHLGTYNTLKTAGFRIKAIAPNDKWHVLRAQSRYLFLKMPDKLAYLLVAPVYWAHRLWWKAASLFSKKATENYRLLLSAGSFLFVVQKP